MTNRLMSEIVSRQHPVSNAAEYHGTGGLPRDARPSHLARSWVTTMPAAVGIVFRGLEQAQLDEETGYWEIL